MFWKDFLKTILILLVIDYVWIAIINKQYYSDIIVSIQKTPFNPRYGFGFVVYICMTLLVISWIIPKVSSVTKNKSDLLFNSYKYGGYLGLLTFAVFDFTNLSMFSNWNLQVSIIDSLWGGFLLGTTTYLSML